MPTGDGLLARIHPPLGILTVAQLRAVADAAPRFGNGHIDVTARANLQLRGVTEATLPELAGFLEHAGLGDARSDGGPQRLTLTSPHAGLSPALLDVSALARAIEAHGRTIAGLPPKTLVLIEGGGATDLPDIAADIHAKADKLGRAAIGLADADGIDWIGTFPESHVAGAVAALLRAFAASGRRRVRDLAQSERRALIGTLPIGASRAVGGHPVPLAGGEGQGEGRAAGGTRAPMRDAPMRPDAVVDGRADAADMGPRKAQPGRPFLRREETRASSDGSETTVQIEAPFGRCTAAMLHRLADVAEALGTDDVRLSPTRGFVLPAGRSATGLRTEHLSDLSACGFVTLPDDPRRAVAACPGAPACASGSTPTGADAARLAEAFRPFAASGMTAHVSGCIKGCAHPGPSDLTLVGREGRYGIVIQGMPGDAPALELTFEATLERVRRAKSGTLAQAFGAPSFGREARAEPAFGTTI